MLYDLKLVGLKDDEIEFLATMMEIKGIQFHLHLNQLTLNRITYYFTPFNKLSLYYSSQL